MYSIAIYLGSNRFSVTKYTYGMFFSIQTLVRNQVIQESLYSGDKEFSGAKFFRDQCLQDPMYSQAKKFSIQRLKENILRKPTYSRFTAL
jgi:hypothetical protein